MSSLFSCRLCSENPLAIWTQIFQGTAPSEQKPKKSGKTTLAKQGSQRRSTADFQRRSIDEIKSCVRSWEQYAHPRAREFFPSKDSLEDVLEQLAKGIHRDMDPVLGDDAKCVYWYGDVTKDDQQAAIKMVKPGDASESITYVNRVLAFIFATDDSFDQLMRLPKEPFKMSCGDQLCVNLAHISLQVDSYECTAATGERESGPASN